MKKKKFLKKKQRIKKPNKKTEIENLQKPLLIFLKRAMIQEIQKKKNKTINPENANNKNNQTISTYFPKNNLSLSPKSLQQEESSTLNVLKQLKPLSH